MKRIAVVGGGIFGTTAALYAARAGHTVHLFEKRPSLLREASGINQYRLHRGYHYPRSTDTALSALQAESSFRAEYSPAVIDGGLHLYAIARERSLVSGKEFLDFCDKHNLSYREVDPGVLINKDMVECVIEGEEAWYDPHMLRHLVKSKLYEAEVTVHYNTKVTLAELDQFDAVVVSTYARHNQHIPDHLPRCAHQYEVCEKPVVTMPTWFGNTGIVVLDGPFMCIDPLGREGTYVLGNVVHAIHTTNTGLAPEISAQLMPYVHQGLIKAPEVTRFKEFIADGTPFIPPLAEARHVGSMYTIRTVLPNLEATDARLTEVRRLDDRLISIFSGKVGNCVEAARQVVTLLGQ